MTCRQWSAAPRRSTLPNKAAFKAGELAGLMYVSYWFAVHRSIKRNRASISDTTTGTALETSTFFSERERYYNTHIRGGAKRERGEPATRIQLCLPRHRGSVSACKPRGGVVSLPYFSPSTKIGQRSTPNSESSISLIGYLPQ